jgi:hypothetical protein
VTAQIVVGHGVGMHQDEVERVERGAIEAELRGAAFGDARLSDRAVWLGARLAARPGVGLPECIGNDSQLEICYRFLSNPRVKPALVLEPHLEQTRHRIAQRGEALALHDTTELEFAGERQGLGPLSSGSRRGFFLHTTLAVTADGSRQPLGVLAARTWVRKDKPRRARTERRPNGQASAKRADRESLRWSEQVQQVENSKPAGVSLIHVGDRETDAFEMLACVQPLRYVLRANHERRVIVGDETTHLRQAAEVSQALLSMSVEVSSHGAAKQPGAAKRHPQRPARDARVTVRGYRVGICEPYKRNGQLLEVNVVQVIELEAPAGQRPIEWVLYTSEPIDTGEQLLRVVDLYRARWVIEEFFKALKTGCEVQSLQLETFKSLCNAVTLNLPIAWQLLLLRSLGRVRPDDPAELVLSATQLDVLRVMGRRELSARPTAAEAMLAVAVLGGYLVTKAKGPPGWLTLGRGMHTLLAFEAGWVAAKASAAKSGKDPLEH